MNVARTVAPLERGQDRVDAFHQPPC
jgi:hypothetical protein